MLLVILLIYQIILPKLFPNILNEKTWTLGKQIVWALSITLTCGLVCYAYSKYFVEFPADKSENNYRMRALLYTGIIGFVLVIFASIIKYIFYRAEVISKKRIELMKNNTAPTPTHLLLEEPKYPILNIKDENENTLLEIPLHELLYIESERNYVNIFCKKTDKIKEISLRCTLKKILETNPHASSLKRCHRAFLVNTDKIESIAGNSRGRRLILSDCTKEVPVSRNYVNEIRELAEEEISFTFD